MTQEVKHDRHRVGRISVELICRAAAYLNPPLEPLIDDCGCRSGS